MWPDVGWVSYGIVLARDCDDFVSGIDGFGKRRALRASSMLVWNGPLGNGGLEIESYMAQPVSSAVAWLFKIAPAGHSPYGCNFNGQTSEQ